MKAYRVDKEELAIDEVEVERFTETQVIFRGERLGLPMDVGERFNTKKHKWTSTFAEAHEYLVSFLEEKLTDHLNAASIIREHINRIKDMS